MTADNGEDGTLYLVTVTETRTGHFWVRAATPQAAREDADILAEGQDDEGWDDFDTDVDVAPARRIARSPREDEPVWSGGPDGRWDIGGSDG